MHPLLKELEKGNDPHEVLEIAPGIVLAARTEPEFPTLAPGAPSRAAEPKIKMAPGVAAAPAPSRDTIRADSADHIGVGDRKPIGKWTKAFIGVVFALLSAGGATAWQHYGDAAKAVIAQWTPWTVASSTPPASAAPAEQPNPPNNQAAAATTAPAPAAQPVEAAAPPAPSPQQAQMQAMAQQIEQLKASVEQLKAGQEQMSRDIAKAAEAKSAEAKPVAEPRPRLAERTAAPKLGAPPRPLGALPARKPRPTVSSAQYAPPPLPPAAGQPVAIAPRPEPPQGGVEPDGNPVVRPPLPLR